MVIMVIFISFSLQTASHTCAYLILCYELIFTVYIQANCISYTGNFCAVFSNDLGCGSCGFNCSGQGKQSISLEPGGQFELSGAPVETLHQTCAEVNSHLYQVSWDYYTLAWLFAEVNSIFGFVSGSRTIVFFFWQNTVFCTIPVI